MPALAQFTTIVLDCADPGPISDFYREVTGWEVTYGDDDCVQLGNGGPIQLSFQRVEGYRAPGWPNATKQAHLDFKVTDLDVSVKKLVSIGSAKPDFQP